jgi:mono/diheme cytochrome c family protein
VDLRALLLLLLALSACARERRGTDALVEPSPDEGAVAYARSCAPCHGLDGGGDGPVAGALAGSMPDLCRLAARNGGVYPRDLVIRSILGEAPVDAHGTRKMPVWSVRYGPPSGATAAAALWAQRRVELLADHVGTLQRRD